MEELSKPSAPNDRPPTEPTEKSRQPGVEPGSAPEEALEIFERALFILEQAGVPVYLTPIHDGGETYTGILIKRTRLEGKRIRYTGTSTGSPG